MQQQQFELHRRPWASCKGLDSALGQNDRLRSTAANQRHKQQCARLRRKRSPTHAFLGVRSKATWWPLHTRWALLPDQRGHVGRQALQLAEPTAFFHRRTARHGTSARGAQLTLLGARLCCGCVTTYTAAVAEPAWAAEQPPCVLLCSAPAGGRLAHCLWISCPESCLPCQTRCQRRSPAS